MVWYESAALNHRHSPALSSSDLRRRTKHKPKGAPEQPTPSTTRQTHQAPGHVPPSRPP